MTVTSHNEQNNTFSSGAMVTFSNKSFQCGIFNYYLLGRIKQVGMYVRMSTVYSEVRSTIKLANCHPEGSGTQYSIYPY